MLQLINPAFRCYVAPNPDSEVEALVIVAVILLAVPLPCDRGRNIRPCAGLGAFGLIERINL
jgi:hypothetical protein